MYSENESGSYESICHFVLDHFNNLPKFRKQINKTSVEEIYLHQVLVFTKS